MTDPERTIAAQATAAGQGAIAVIRMSGSGCMDILKQCTPAAFTERLRPRRATLVCIRDAEGAAIDQALVTWFPAPASYTGEDTAEISCHGGMLVTDRLLKRLYQCGASPAEPGEFTKRAFLNGRMDLTKGHMTMTILLILWVSAIVSSFLDNIPFVATLIPLILTMQSSGVDVTPLWWAVSLGACLGGNGTLIGASANVVLSGISTRHGFPITFASYLKVGFPMMLVSVAISTVFLLIRFG